jgi:hypothetical protein
MLFKRFFGKSEAFRFFELPIELQRLSVAYIKYPEMKALKLASKAFNALYNDEQLWALKLKEDFPESQGPNFESYKKTYINELWLLTQNVCSEWIDYSKSENKILVKKAFDLGANIQGCPQLSYNCLLNAISAKDSELLSLFLENGADPNANTPDNNLRILLESVHSSLESFEILCKAGANITSESVDGKFLLHFTKNIGVWKLAFEYGLSHKHRSKFMCKLGTNLLILAVRSNIFDKEILDLLVESHKEEIHEALNLSLQYDNLKIARYLIDKGADFKHPFYETSNLNMIKFNVNFIGCETIMREEAEQLLLDIGYSLDE